MSDDEDAKPSKVASKPEKKINDDMGVIEKRSKEVESFLAKQNPKVRPPAPRAHISVLTFARGNAPRMLCCAPSTTRRWARKTRRPRT